MNDALAESYAYADTPKNLEVAVAAGDGIGPEIMEATLKILEAAGVTLEYRFIDLGETVYKSGHSAGIRPEDWETLRRSAALLKGPITTPQGGGYKSLNVTIRKSLGLYSNVRPVRAYSPFVSTVHPELDMVIIRENEEDLYAGIEHRQTEEVYQCLKLITRPGCERICRYAFEYARANGRKKITCMTKDNIMKLTDGLFHKVFDEIGAEYPDIQQEHKIVDIGMARVAKVPEQFDVIVTPNLYGDIISDIVAEIAGSVGLSPSSNVGDNFAMFEAIHGSAPDIAGQNKANPSGLLLAAVMMLVHLGKTEEATRIHNAWLCAIEEGFHTADIYAPETSKSLVGTREFADAVIQRLGRIPSQFAAVSYQAAPALKKWRRSSELAPKKKDFVGIDIFVQWNDDVEALAAKLKQCELETMKLQMITNRGVKVWPNGLPETFHTDHWRCRFINEQQSPIQRSEIAKLIANVTEVDLDFIKAETLCLFDGQPGFSLGQGQ